MSRTLVSAYVLLVPFLGLSELSAEEGAVVPLCRALERLGPGDQVPVIVSGVYAVNYFYDPEKPKCRLDVDPSVCVEFSPDLERPAKFDAFHRKALRVFATFSGVLHGRVTSPEIGDPNLPASARVAAVNRSRHCGYQYRSKLVVNSILDFEKVPRRFPWRRSSRGGTESPPFPLDMALPAYPDFALALQSEGSVLIRATIQGGAVGDASIQYGDPVLAEEAAANLKTWRFESSVSTSLVVEYDFRLESRPVAEGKNPEYEMRLPHYIKIIGARKSW